ncbi:hypothetical protein B4U51_08095 [Listeria monocytogenes]|uniref:hypothetical protein n=1 Tax=Listeria monocytogenes TaxID=1639 RepID=UPI0010B73FC3|nr:hypothetical protein [Listeria monocytogenes]EAC8166999.1 hypothetical protein [Listeria monocytogenes]EAD0607461.1 hypothetical protein [Listeria monocytogenes]EAD2110277.1 hypothetical protein [Listeria monocytogenes]EAD8566447.1 hypothetical protein [Listeria monocytogenes]EAE8362097.1 hypothetical protein [Listeria monocytogenes]
MNEEITQLLKNFDNNKLPLFFEKLILFINNHDKIFRKYILEDSLNSIERFKESEFFLGTTDDNLEGLVLGYSETLIRADENEICRNVIHMIWDIATFMTDELCPSCQDANLKIASSTDRSKIYKTCDNCLITIENGQFSERPKEIIPATRKQINR